MGVRLRSLLTSSHIRSSPKGSAVMVLSSRDRIQPASRTDLLCPRNAAACVSLSKSTMSKTRPACRPHRFAPGGGEERRIYSPLWSVSIGLFFFFTEWGEADQRAQKSLQAAERQPSLVRNDSIEVADNKSRSGKLQERFGLLQLAGRLSVSARGGLYPRIFGRATPLGKFFGKSSVPGQSFMVIVRGWTISLNGSSPSHRSASWARAG